MQLNDIVKEDKLQEAFSFATANGYIIREIEKNIDNERQFQIQEIPVPTEEELKEMRIYEIQQRLVELDQDIVQDIAGEVVPNIEERKVEFVTLHNELRLLLGKKERKLKNTTNNLVQKSEQTDEVELDVTDTHGNAYEQNPEIETIKQSD